MLAAAAAAVTVLVARDPRVRAGAMLAALAFSALTVATLASSLPGGRGGAGRRRAGGDRRAGRARGAAGAPPGARGAARPGRAAVPGPADARRRHGEPAAAPLRRHRGRGPGRGVALAAARPRPGGARRRRAPRPRHAAPRADRARGGRRPLRAAGRLLLRPRGRAQERLPLLRAVRGAVPAAVRRGVERRAPAPRLLADHRAGDPVRRRRLLRVRERPPAALQRQGPGSQRAQALLPGQLAVLRPEHLRALPRAGDDRARRDAASGAATAAAC